MLDNYIKLVYSLAGSKSVVKNNAKEKLLTSGAEIIYMKGFNNTGLNEILEAAGVPKGSFYHHFGSKADFGLHLIDHFLQKFLADAERYLTATTSSYLQSLQNFFDDF